MDGPPPPQPMAEPMSHPEPDWMEEFLQVQQFRPQFVNVHLHPESDSMSIARLNYDQNTGVFSHQEGANPFTMNHATDLWDSFNFLAPQQPVHFAGQTDINPSQVLSFLLFTSFVYPLHYPVLKINADYLPTSTSGNGFEPTNGWQC